MAVTKNLCAQLSLDLHQKICEEREQAGLTTAQYITNILTEYFTMKEKGGNQVMTNNTTRTMAIQIGEDLFQRIKAHLERETARTGHKLTQREFVLGLIEEALNEAEAEAAAKSPPQLEQTSEGALRSQRSAPRFALTSVCPFEAVCGPGEPGSIRAPPKV